MQEHYDFRERLAQSLERDLIGPKGPNETIEDAPLTQYLAGILYPARSGTVDPSKDIDRVEGDKENEPDPPVALAHVRYPSSMGMTFAVDSRTVREITVHSSAARYRKSGEPEKRNERKARGGGWERVPLALPDQKIDVGVPGSEEYKLAGSDLGLFVRVRPADAEGIVPVTVVLVNRREAPAQGLMDADAVFQPRLEVTSTGAFAERPSTSAAGADDDIKAYRLLYRHAREFGVGHGCSVEWDVDPADPARAGALRTTFAPSYPVLLADSNPDIKIAGLSLEFLVKESRLAVLAEFGKLCAGYEEWIAARRAELDAIALTGAQRTTAEEHLAQCAEAVGRMRVGIATLGGDDPLPWKAFALTNRAMLANRARSVWLKEEKPTPEPVEDGRHAWRPFQLAFLLLCLPGIADPKSPDRDFADLLWFPTGGGKTEAYLGLIAFTVFLRRLRHRDGGGITALMRYTLRLLTIQQFERAALLICCCEELRRGMPSELGKEEISLGLWLGRGATPNTLAEARDALNKLRQNRVLESMNPMQLQACPWCGKELEHRNYWIATTPPRLTISCHNRQCAFEKGLPAMVVDDDVYNYRPTLLIATVDKFASMPWREHAASLFNLQDGSTREQLPPELIIQDELHLISGPLGTLVGLYESALDAVCSRHDIRPKTIASTATIRRADDQTLRLFAREMRQFPPPGLDARDSYFAREAPADRKGSRLYLGLMAPGASHATLLVRTYAALLQNADEIPGTAAVKDSYWTLVGYFNSLRVLGGATLQVRDDVSDRMDLLARLHEKAKRDVKQENMIELTSREPSSKVPEHLRRMADALPSPDTLDVLLATNMISVGVDIDRLGLMAVMGQPQSTSEYIQATSRVGRKHPGLVVVLFNGARSRDRSHYEAFVSYHAALYRQVESTSVTPFSARARDRGLHAVLVSLARLLEPAFRGNVGAAAAPAQLAALERFKEKIVERVRRVEPDEADATEAQLTEIIHEWVRRAEAGGTLAFQGKPGVNPSFLVSAGDDQPDDAEALPTLWSLRDVDQESNLYLVH